MGVWMVFFLTKKSWMKRITAIHFLPFPSSTPFPSSPPFPSSSHLPPIANYQSPTVYWIPTSTSSGSVRIVSEHRILIESVRWLALALAVQKGAVGYFINATTASASHLSQIFHPSSGFHTLFSYNQTHLYRIWMTATTLAYIVDPIQSTAQALAIPTFLVSFIQSTPSVEGNSPHPSIMAAPSYS